jgi:hypothetical protein
VEWYRSAVSIAGTELFLRCFWELNERPLRQTNQAAEEAAAQIHDPSTRRGHFHGVCRLIAYRWRHSLSHFLFL